MTVIAFDTLKLARKLEAGGFSAQQAESFAEAFADVVQDAPGADQWAELRAEMATKKDLEAFATKKDLEVLRSQIMAEIYAAKHDMLKWAVAALAAQGALIVAILKLLL